MNETRTGRNQALRLRRLGIDSQRQHVVLMRADCHVCRAEGFEALARVRVAHGSREITAVLNVIRSDILKSGEASLSEEAWRVLGAGEGDPIIVRHADPLRSTAHVRAKIFGHTLSQQQLSEILADIVAGRYPDVDIAAFLVACAREMGDGEVTGLTRAMVEVGQRLRWGSDVVADKHCVGGLPGNRTTMIVVPIAMAAGLMVPKTSSRAITSPAGTADTMEVLTRVDLGLKEMRRVVQQVGGCIAWGGSMALSPADDRLVRVERALDLDSVGQLVASVLSKKAAAGSTHVVIDIPVGPTAKVRDRAAADRLAALMQTVGEAIGLNLRVLQTNGTQPVGRGIGPALEAKDVLAVLQGKADAPPDLRARALHIAAALLELSGATAADDAQSRATQILASGAAWEKFQAVCEAQGGMREIPAAVQRHAVTAPHSGKVAAVDNRRLARAAKLAGAPAAKAAGIELQASPGTEVQRGQPLFVVHAETPGELEYALGYVEANPDILRIEEPT